MVIPAAIREQLHAHARDEAPNEACGLLAFRDGVAERYLPGENALASPYRFELRPRDPADFFLEDEGYELAGWRISDGRVEPLALAASV